ncbi:hypothetical protein KDL29_03145 [bacterium]|nr:hypothetical protein [bacterium]
MNTAKRRSSGWITLFSLLLAIALLPACSAGTDGNPVQSQADLQQELEGRLLSELARLGKDPDRSVASAPQGSGNAVFNLTAEPDDPDGPGGQPPLSVELSWTARIVGDYDQNGEVGIADITPLGQFFKQSVAYDDPLDHDGISFWPAGDPLGDGKANWRSAAVDGDANGEINAADITPIAIHFGERIDGFNIYVKQTGETEFSILPNLLDPFVSVSVSLKAAGNGPANYTASIPWPSSGIAEIAVAGYDSQSSSAAQLSNIVSVSGDPGAPPAACVAELTVDVPSGQAPLGVMFGLGSSSTAGPGDYRYVLDSGEGGARFSFEDSASFPLAYTFLSGGSFNAVLAVVCLADGQVAFSDPVSVTVTDPAGPGLNLNGFVWQYESNPELGGQDEPPKDPLEGIEVEVYILGESTPLAVTTTAANGEYVFPNLQIDESVELLNVKVSDAQKAELLPLTWLPGERILLLDSHEQFTAADMNLLATAV